MTDDTPTFGGSDMPNLPDTNGAVDMDSNETILSQMMEEASQDIEVEDISLVVPERPHFELIFKPYIDYDLFNKMMKSARKVNDSGKKEWHPVVFSLSVMSHCTTGVAYKGQAVSDNEGDDLTILSPLFLSMFKAKSLGVAMKNLCVHDGHIIAIAQKVVDEAGYGDVDIESGEGGPLAG